ncbi:MerR family transcriptional regulator [Anaeromicrobium sediminis]|uniref:HTH merR-type domain-containing protein n=1 Tax=Anaeromicrobium sediminis TaxID=1478221 RepID=A0A267MAG9_9FIRM|nr:MerR family transcriptional regulator [Anaeromicrobium sediminis]PAB55845.1 hypothetical protein CCE28_21565 [Anaeromicrobium sediminis]
MKIGYVSKKLGISTDTIRYYIKIGLIVPYKNTSSHHYEFCEQDLEELSLILQLKSLNFHLDEIHKILSLHRVSYLNAEREVEHYLKLLKDKKSELNFKMEKLQQSIVEINNLIDEAEKNLSTHYIPSGIDLSFLKLLVCSECDSSLTLKNATINNNEILDGILQCSCGYEATIENGILLTSQISATQSSNNFDINPTLLSEYSAEQVSSWKKEMDNLLLAINNNDLNDKVIIETNIKRLFFLLKNISKLDSRGMYIITESYPEVIKFYKTQIDRLNLNRKILFIVSNNHNYPLKKSSIDIWIDYSDSNENMEKEGIILPKTLAKYFKIGAKIYGTFVSTPNHAPYLEQFKKTYPKVNMHDFVDNNFFNLMEKSGYSIISKQFTREIWEYSKQSKIKITGVPSKMILYHSTYNGTHNDS